MTLTWMAWTWQTAVFWLFILSLLLAMAMWEKFSPGGNPRRGILGLDTTRGDRLFISLMVAAWIHLGWLFVAGPPLLGAAIASVVVAILIFRLV